MCLAVLQPAEKKEGEEVKNEFCLLKDKKRHFDI
jgi:hypothetical protein